VSCDSAKECIIDPDEGLRDDDHDSDAGITNVPNRERGMFLAFARTAPRPTSAALDLSTGNDSPRPFGSIASAANLQMRWQPSRELERLRTGGAMPGDMTAPTNRLCSPRALRSRSML
jgi:hypothetical protein